MADKYEGRKFKTIFAGKDLPEDSRLAEIMRWGADLYSMGLLPAERALEVLAIFHFAIAGLFTAPSPSFPGGWCRN